MSPCILTVSMTGKSDDAGAHKNHHRNRFAKRAHRSEAAGHNAKKNMPRASLLTLTALAPATDQRKRLTVDWSTCAPCPRLQEFDQLHSKMPAGSWRVLKPTTPLNAKSHFPPPLPSHGALTAAQTLTGPSTALLDKSYGYCDYASRLMTGIKNQAPTSDHCFASRLSDTGILVPSCWANRDTRYSSSIQRYSCSSGSYLPSF